MLHRYAQAVAYWAGLGGLTPPPPAERRAAWFEPWSHPHGGLFAACTPTGRHARRPPPDGRPCGCPLAVWRGTHLAWTDALTEKCRGLPLARSPGRLTLEGLKALARLQTELDQTVRCRDWRREFGVEGEDDFWEAW